MSFLLILCSQLIYIKLKNKDNCTQDLHSSNSSTWLLSSKLFFFYNQVQYVQLQGTCLTGGGGFDLSHCVRH